MDKKATKEHMQIGKELKKLVSIFNTAGFSLYLVGGGVRDFYLGRKGYDIDVATDVMRLFKKTIPTGIKHGTITIRFMGCNIECTTMRRDAKYTDGRHPDSVEYGTSIIEDLSRRDFTMNAIAASLPLGEIIDPYGGREDIKKGLIRSVGSAKMRFEEDGLRPIRAIRFASQLGFRIEDETLNAIPASLEKVSSVSIERFLDELNKMLKAKYLHLGFSLMRRLKISQIFIPELEKLKEEDFDSLLVAIDFIDSTFPLLRLSLICYWIYREGKKKIEIIKSMLKRLKYPNKTIEEVLHLLQHCDFDIDELNTDSSLRFFLKDAGGENVQNIFTLKKAIVKALDTDFSLSLKEIENIEERICAMMEDAPPLSIKDLAINGGDLLEIGIKPGPILGAILSYLLDAVIKEPKNNTKEILLTLAKNYSIENV